MKKKGAKTSIEKALDLIETLKEKDNLGVTELSGILGLNKNNVFRILATLEVKGIVEQDKDTGHYRLGMKLLSLEYAYIKNLPFLKKAKPFMRHLRNRTLESVYISVLHKNSVVYIYSEETKRSVLVNSRIGKRYLAEETAAGKAILKSKKSTEFIVEEDIEGAEPEVVELATVIKDETNHPIAALSIIAPSERYKKEDREFMRSMLIETGRAISEKLSL
ncbi:transcriptional regulator, IclR family [Persephonella hydrogeniphila]|uniref:Transcriptional regulator, IclR family n=1 Tax=Persephonella hydrogeniphila TaxID=198703 RepID=A0A285NQP8_9AQUI|nr:IclR family transcriptional regulator [Persephonella hydrogeniphila]SNZ09951.1 transcriptional regulator, IclR family [Persephonella hydrogeniphila]